MRYLIGDLIGTGSFGRVHEAHDGAGKRYAVKVVDSGDEVGLTLLRAQYRLLSAADHPRVVTAYDLVEEAGHDPYLVMEYVRGCSLADYVRGNGPEDLPRIAAQALDALRHIHSLGGTHGDLKPDNILVYDGGGGVEIRLIDVGFDASVGDRLPTIQGTLPYLAPEVIRAAPADGRSDLYSLGVTLFESLTGACPFGGSTQEEIMSRHLEFSPPPPSTVSEGIDPAWDVFIGRLLCKEPTQRYPGALHAIIALANDLGGGSHIIEQMTPPRTLGRLWAAHALRVEESMAERPGRAVVLEGCPGSGTANVLRAAANRLKSAGTKVVSVTMSEDTPVSSQVIGALVGDEAGEPVGSGDMRPQVTDQLLFSLDSILAAYDVPIGESGRIAMVIDGGRVIDPAGVNAMTALAARYEDALSVILGVESAAGSERPGEGGAAAQPVSLEPLSKAEVEKVLGEHFGTASVPLNLLESLYGNTRGRAALLEEMIAELWRRGDLRYVLSDGVLSIQWDEHRALPVSLQQVLEHKVGSLEDPARRAAGMIALANGVLEGGVILDVLGTDEGGAAIEELKSAGLVDEMDERGRLHMGHSETRPLVLRSLPAGWAGDIAERLAAAIERLETDGDVPYRMGSLYLEAGRPDLALPHLMRAGEYFARFSSTDAVLAYGKALRCEPGPALRAELEEKMGDMKVIEKDFDSAADLFGRASALRPEARRKLGWATALKGMYEDAEAILTGCAEAAGERDDRAEKAKTELDLGYVYAVRGKIKESLKVLRAAQGFFERQGMTFETGLAVYRSGISHMRAGSYSKAISAWESAVPLFERAGSRRHVALSLAVIGYSSRKELEYERARESLRRAHDIWTDLRILPDRAGCSNNYAFVLLETGDLRAARRYADEALELDTVAGDRDGALLDRLLIAMIELEIGNWKNAERLIAEAGEGIGPEDLYHKAQIPRYQAAARMLAGDRDEAVALLKESYSLSRLAKDDEGKSQALLETACVHLRFGNPGEACEAAREALISLAAGSSLLLAARAQAALGEALCMSGRIDEGFEKLEAARENLKPMSRSQYMGRVLRGLAHASYLRGDHLTFSKFFDQALSVLRGAEARYDYSVALQLGAMEAMKRGSFLRARHYLSEAARIFGSLDIQDLHEKVVRAMEAIPGGDIQIEAVNSLSRISETLISNKDLDSVLNLAMDLAMDYLGADRGVLMLAADRTGELVTVVQRKMDRESLAEVIDISKSIVESVHETRKAVIATDLKEDPRFSHSKSIRAHNIMSVMCLPLMRGRNLLGLIYLDTRGIPSAFSSLERAFVDAFANQVSLALENARMVGHLRNDFEDLRDRVGERFRFDNIIGPGKGMQEVFRQVEKIAPTDTSVLLTGENGTGKDLIAGLIHELSPRRAAPFVIVNCPGIADDLVESELFGIEKSVATGVAPRPGFFERADGGTIFLDEIGDLAEGTQVKVLRVIESMEFERVGGSKVIKVDVRVISATNRDIQQLLDEGSFRRDLYFRLNTIQIQLPPLRKRMEDLPRLVDHFVRKYALKNGKPVKRVSPEALEMLRKHTWPGNVRELEKCLEHAVVFADGDEIVPDNLKDEITGAAGAGILPAADWTGSLPDKVARLEEFCIAEALAAADWNKTQAARSLGIHESTLRKKVKAYSIEKPRT